MPEILITPKVEFMSEFTPSMTEFSDIKLFHRIDREKLIELRTEQVNWILLDGEVVNPFAFRDFRTLFKGEQVKIFYIRHDIQTESQERQLASLAKMHDVILIQEDITPRQIAHVMKGYLFDALLKTNTRMFSFFGTHGGAGVTTTAFNTAKLLADKIKGDVIFFSLDSYDAGDYLYVYEGRSLDDLKSDLQYGDLNEQDLKDASHKHSNNFYHLAGNKDIKLQGFYTGKEIDTLFEIVSKSFDAIIVDAGSHFDSASVTQAYMQSGTKFLVSTQEPKGYRGNFLRVSSQLIEPTGGDPTDFQLIVNKYQPNNALPKDSEIEADTGALRLTTIPDEGSDMIKTTKNGGFHVDVGSGAYKESFEELTNFIANEAKFTLEGKQNKKRRGIFG